MAQKEHHTSKRNILIIVGVVIAFAAGLAVGVFAAPYVLFGGHGHYTGRPGGFPMNKSKASYADYNYSVNIATLPGIGQYLVNKTGWALYMYTPDTPNSGKSTCYGECAVAWPIFYTSSLTVAPGINPALFGTINRTDGTKQLTYNGYPLYYYQYDTGAGNVNGQGVGGIWYLLSPSGSVIENSTS